MNTGRFSLYFSLLLTLIAVGCREDELVVPTEYEIIGDETREGDIRGFYLVNEGNMGSNKCTLDFYDYHTGLYSRNFYAEKNPNVIKELGDVGNDIGIYGSKLYVVVNCSHKVEVLDSRSGLRLGLIAIPNCRYVRFRRGKASV
ncbi:MAG: YncE family protein, partial [Muribaculaceae bacterium]|nr:YncE family protein [Muribaculaceae bacterium]